ncbi:CinA family protein [Azomonas macrocytogenes]|uniref:Nicotinamide-nucleotide amidase n=1 Tax=Azomonas macrocytogenes TaxID=69962 RepID=A0A839T4K4_AZOMA|nr:nicotinamide-nucleotide amidohydrolase family protein [Azomonas macrocytogenes]MBB3104467.1 nicotinamide-nucleotide amidase [Azomonas macrocytogenes]
MDNLTRLAEQLGQSLVARSAKVSTAESCTGGGIAEAITRIAGSSAWFEAGYVTYSNEQKTRQLGVPAMLFEQVGAVSREVVEAMVCGAQRNNGAHFVVAVSGIAGPGGGSPEKPVGTVWLGWAAGNALYARCYHFSGDRLAIRMQAVEAGLSGLLELCNGGNPDTNCRAIAS